MKKNRRKYSREFKLEAIRLWQATGKSAREIEDDLGITGGRLYRWKRQLEAQGDDSFPGQGRIPAADEEFRHLQRELGIVKQERDILKKAVATALPSRSQANEIPIHRRLSTRVASESHVRGAGSVAQWLLCLAHPTAQRARDGESKALGTDREHS